MRFISLILSMGLPVILHAKETDTLKNSLIREKNEIRDTVVIPKRITNLPSTSLQQYLKGENVGLYIKENNGEPGTIQSMYIRGITKPVLNPTDNYQLQPLIVLDGIPMAGDHPFSYDIQENNVNKLGPATNLLATIDIDNIESIEILKDPADIAQFGPLGGNGVIKITTKAPLGGKQIGVNFYTGVSFKPQVETINANFENRFRKQFYNQYANDYELDTYPVFLSDSMNNDYYGPSNWSDSYYKNGILEDFNANISTDTKNAKFKFSLGNLINKGIADGTGLKRYSARFLVEMKPLNWLWVSALVNGNRLERDRNRNLRDRFAEMNYLPDLTSPLSPNKGNYNSYLEEFDQSFDKNITNLINGNISLKVNLGKFNFTSRIIADYNEGNRDVFYPKALLIDNSYASNYYGLNQRIFFDNTAIYNFNINSENQVDLKAGTSLDWETYKYNYMKGFRGVNDFIQILTSSGAFPKQLLYKYIDKTVHNMISFYGSGSYQYKSIFNAALFLRADGSSNEQPTSRWLFQPSLKINWNIKENLLKENNLLSTLKIIASLGRIGLLNSSDYYSQGPLYQSEIGYTGNSTIPSYIGISTLTRPYSQGWIGYNLNWAYSDQLDLGLNIGIQNDRLNAAINYYIKNNKNQLIGIPSYMEYGYSQSYMAGMNVQNQGIEFALNWQILYGQKDKLKWNFALNISYNKNTLQQLPNQLNELTIDNRLLKVGQSIDQFWLYKNEGIYQAQNEIPVGKNYSGILFKPGDPIWNDANIDNRIDESDKILTGHIFPKYTGGFSNHLSYKNWDLNTTFYFNIGRDIINAEMANKFDFINQESEPTINNIKEITYWEKRGDYTKYPLYNPWSNVIPYRKDQDLFLENGSFLKLKTIQLGYDLSKIIYKNHKNGHIKKFYIYGTANNIFTISPYSGRDPELVDYTGFDYGYNMAIPSSYTLGIKMGL
ncbi:TonB-linked outer membrane protein, SusC/RagA family [bacterium A37T11]|nr:TonB-linked outer membrane protein, SusC/RagA family [bacterium A37T11]